IWWQGRNLACSLRKIMSIGGIYRQTNLAIVVENDGISFLKAKWVDDRPALDAANATLSGSLNAASRPRCAASWTLLINEGIITKGDLVRHHCAGRSCQREHAQLL